MAVKTLTVRLSELLNNNEDVVFAYDFSNYAEFVVGQSIVAATVQYAAKGAAPALLLPAATSVPGTVFGAQVQVEVKPDPSSAGSAYSFSFTATFSGGDTRVGYGLLQVDQLP